MNENMNGFDVEEENDVDTRREGRRNDETIVDGGEDYDDDW